MRQWRDVDAAREFRAFVHRGKLTACSQYCYYQCFPELVADREVLSNRIKEFFESRVLPAFPYNDAVVDLHVSDQAVELIELSPYNAQVGACMFSWKVEEDREILENGPFELRILREPKLNPYECLPSKWRTWFESERGFSLRTNQKERPKPPANAPPPLPTAAPPQGKVVSPREAGAKKKLFGSTGKADGEKKKKGWSFGKKKE